MIYQLAFTGRISSKVDVSEHLQEMCETHSNEDIRGIVLYKDNTILQILEGPQAEVFEHYIQTEKDPRNFDLRIIHEGHLTIPSCKSPNITHKEVETLDYIRSVERSLRSARMAAL